MLKATLEVSDFLLRFFPKVTFLERVQKVVTAHVLVKYGGGALGAAAGPFTIAVVQADRTGGALTFELFRGALVLLGKKGLEHLLRIKNGGFVLDHLKLFPLNKALFLLCWVFTYRYDTWGMNFGG